jgi:hypothetical protein
MSLNPKFHSGVSRNLLPAQSLALPRTLFTGPSPLQLVYSVVFLSLGGAALTFYLTTTPSTDPLLGHPLFRAMISLIPMYAGLATLAGNLIGFCAIRRRKRLLAKNFPPWLADYPWNEKKANARSRIDSIQFIVFFLPIATLIASIALLIFLLGGWQHTGGKIVGICIGVLAALFGLCILKCLFRIVTTTIWGPSEARFDKFPFHLGTNLSLTVVGYRGAASPAIRCTLFCLSDDFIDVPPEPGYSRSKSLLSTVLWAESTSVMGQIGDEGFKVRFPLPQQKEFSTRLSQRPPVYWMLEVESPGYRPETYLMPVYRPHH